MLLLALAAVTYTPPPADAMLQTRMVALYEEACLKTFPDDAALDALMAARGATALTPEQVRGTLTDDPGRGWLVPDGGGRFQVMLELPPYHACSVRRMTTSGFADLSSYRQAIDRYKAGHPGFQEGQPLDMDIGDIHAHASGPMRPVPGKQAETLLIFDQKIIDPARRAAGETAVEIRFVHQIVD